MEVPDILAQFERNRGAFPQEAVEAAISRRDEITPDLLRILEDTLERAAALAAEDSDEPWMGHFHAFYLLAQFRDPRAYPLAIRFARLPSATLDALGGDLVTEGFPRILASVFAGDLGPIRALIEDADVDEYARCSALGALAVLVTTGRLSREEAVAYLAQLFRGGLPRRAAMIWDCLASCAVDLHPGELLADLRRAYDEKLCKSSWIPWKEIVAEAAKPVAVTLAETLERDGGLIDDTVAELGWWHCFQPDGDDDGLDDDGLDGDGPGDDGPGDDGPDDEWLDDDDVPGAAYAEAADTPPVVPPYVREEPKIGRNEPCPCGSGKKYKKCCGQ